MSTKFGRPCLPCNDGKFGVEGFDNTREQRIVTEQSCSEKGVDTFFPVPITLILKKKTKDRCYQTHEEKVFVPVCEIFSTDDERGPSENVVFGFLDVCLCVIGSQFGPCMNMMTYAEMMREQLPPTGSLNDNSIIACAYPCGIARHQVASLRSSGDNAIRCSLG